MLCLDQAPGRTGTGTGNESSRTRRRTGNEKEKSGSRTRKKGCANAHWLPRAGPGKDPRPPPLHPQSPQGGGAPACPRPQPCPPPPKAGATGRALAFSRLARYLGLRCHKVSSQTRPLIRAKSEARPELKIYDARGLANQRGESARRLAVSQLADSQDDYEPAPLAPASRRVRSKDRWRG